MAITSGALANFNALMQNWFGSHGRRHKAVYPFQPQAGDYGAQGGPDSDVSESNGNAVAYADGTCELPMNSSLAVSATSGIVAGRSCAFVITTAGTVTVKFAGDASTLQITLPVGLTVLPWAVQGVTFGTAVGTATNLF